MNRRAMNLLALASALLSLTSIVSWWRSYVRLDWFEAVTVSSDNRTRNTYRLFTSRGSVFLDRTHTRRVTPPMSWHSGPGFSHESVPINEVYDWNETRARRRGFGFHLSADSDSESRFDGQRVWGPHWVVVVGFAALPTGVFVARYRAKRMLSTGTLRCTDCGYDLRATPVCCPECGKVPEEAALVHARLHRT